MISEAPVCSAVCSYKFGFCFSFNLNNYALSIAHVGPECPTFIKNLVTILLRFR